VAPPAKEEARVSTAIERFVGIWTSAAHPALSRNTLTLEVRGDKLVGRWEIRPSASIPLEKAAGFPGIDATLDDAVVQEDAVLFLRTSITPMPIEFRLLGEGKAVMGAPQAMIHAHEPGSPIHRSLMGHQIHLSREERASGSQ
jgi:hypothetical protein